MRVNDHESMHMRNFCHFLFCKDPENCCRYHHPQDVVHFFVTPPNSHHNTDKAASVCRNHGYVVIMMSLDKKIYPVVICTSPFLSSSTGENMPGLLKMKFSFSRWHNDLAGYFLVIAQLYTLCCDNCCSAP